VGPASGWWDLWAVLLTFRRSLLPLSSTPTFPCRCKVSCWHFTDPHHPKSQTESTIYLSVISPKEFYLLGNNAVQSVESQIMFRKNTPPPTSGSKNKRSKKPTRKQVASRAIGGDYVLPKPRLTFNGLHGVITTAVRTYNRMVPSPINMIHIPSDCK
jgi:hypothetical protein